MYRAPRQKHNTPPMTLERRNGFKEKIGAFFEDQFFWKKIQHEMITLHPKWKLETISGPRFF